MRYRVTATVVVSDVVFHVEADDEASAKTIAERLSVDFCAEATTRDVIVERVDPE